MLLGHHGFSCSAAELWYRVLQCCKVSSVAMHCWRCTWFPGKSDFSTQGVVSHTACVIRAKWAPGSPIMQIPLAKTVVDMPKIDCQQNKIWTKNNPWSFFHCLKWHNKQDVMAADKFIYKGKPFCLFFLYNCIPCFDRLHYASFYWIFYKLYDGFIIFL